LSNRHLGSVLVGLALAACGGGTTTPAPSQPSPAGPFPAASPATMRAELTAFAHDSMEGREAGTRGNFKGTAWIAAQAQKIGLKPAGENGTWFQEVPLVERGVDRNSTLAAGGAPLVLNTDYISFGGIPQLGFAPGLTGTDIPSVFGGRLGDSVSTVSAEQVKGKVVVLLPPLGSGGQPTWQFWRSLDKRYADAAAIAIVALEDVPPPVLDFLGKPQMALKSAEPQARTGGKLFAMMLTEGAATKVLGASPATLSPGAAGRPVNANISTVSGPVAFPARNVIGMIPGSDPKLKGEYVAIGAHNDHVGMSSVVVDHDSLRAFNTVVRPAGAESEMRTATAEEMVKVKAILDSLRKTRKPRLDSVRNGADDDGSGTVTVLAIAQALQQSKVRPKRSVLFVWHTGEEKGLWGSKYFTDNPTVPRDSIVAQLNMDMVGRGDATDMVLGEPGTVGGPDYLQLVGSRRLSTELGDLVERVNTDGHFGFQFDYTFDQNGHPANIYCRSDHYMYARWGIPVVFFTTGVHRDYHESTDEVEYINFPKMARIATFVSTVALGVANADHRPVVDKPKPDPNGQCRQ